MAGRTDLEDLERTVLLSFALRLKTKELQQTSDPGLLFVDIWVSKFKYLYSRTEQISKYMMGN